MRPWLIDWAMCRTRTCGPSRKPACSGCDVCPTDEIRLDRPIQRLLRDLIAFTHQGAMAPYVNWERYGRQLVGANPAPPIPPGR